MLGMLGMVLTLRVVRSSWSEWSDRSEDWKKKPQRSGLPSGLIAGASVWIDGVGPIGA